MTSPDESARPPLDENTAELYDALRKMAQRLLRSDGGRRTLDPTDVVHEVFVRLSRGEPLDGLARASFLSLAATAMRHVLVDEAKRRRALKRGRDFEAVALSSVHLRVDEPELDVLDLDAALSKLKKLDERQARIVELRFFAGLSGEQVAALLGLTRRTVTNEWAMARAWLKRELSRGQRE